MVLKVSKHGIRSGNSFKTKELSAKHRHFRKESLIIKDLILTDGNIDKENVLGDIDIRSYQVPYSMNKKGRWGLPDIIKTSIEDGDFDGEPFAVQIVERDKLLKRPDCLSIHSSTKLNDWNNNEDRRNVYLNANSILTPRTTTLTRRERRYRTRRDLPINEEPVVVQSAVRYEVLYPPSATSGVSYSPKYTGFREGCGCTWRRRRRCDCDYRRVGFNRKRCREDILEEIENFRSNAYEEDKLPYQSNVYSYCSTNTNNNVAFGDVFNDITAVKRQKRRKRRKPSTESGIADVGIATKGNIVYEQIKVKAETVQEIVTEAIPAENAPVEPVLVALSNEEVDHQTLTRIYGQSYVECDCFPRKFIIDISERMKRSRPSTGTTGEGELIACVIFCWDIDNTCNTAEEEIYKVTLKTADNICHSKIETLPDYTHTTVEECLNVSVALIETRLAISEDNLSTSIPFFRHPKMSRTTNVERCANWETDCFVPSKRFYYSTFLSLIKRDCDMNEMDFEYVRLADSYDKDKLKMVACLDGKTCDICYESLGIQVPGTALTSCGHWFCDSCWLDYLESRVNRAATLLTCPEYDCDKQIDPGTVVTLLSLRDVVRHAKYCHDNKVERSVDTKWCPNTKCDRVLKVNRLDVKVMGCKCGQLSCFDCLGTSHWPAPCQAYVQYSKRLQETGDIGLAPVDVLDQVIVNGKNCPHCHKFLEKNGGCPFMSCVCGRYFCWGCGKDWNSNVHGDSCYKQGYKNNHQTTEVIVEDVRLKMNNKKKKWYNIAVKHRTEQHPFKQEKMKTAKKHLIKHLSCYIGKNARKGVRVSLDFQGQKRTYRNEQDKLSEYLTELIDLYRELNQVAENTAVLVDSNQLPPNEVTLVKNIIGRLSSFAGGIWNGFSQGMHIRPEDLLAMFKKIRINSYSSIRALFTLVNQL